MSLATRPVDDGTGLFEYRLTAWTKAQMVSNEADEPQKPSSKDLQRERELARKKEQPAGRHRPPKDKDSLLGRIRPPKER